MARQPHIHLPGAVYHVMLRGKGGHMNERYLLTASQYVELNPVRAKLVESPETYKWSSAIAHLNKQDDELVKVSPLLNLGGHWKEFLAQKVPASEMEAVRYHERTGRPLGGEKFVAKIEKALGRMLHRQKPDPKQRTNN